MNANNRRILLACAALVAITLSGAGCAAGTNPASALTPGAAESHAHQAQQKLYVANYLANSGIGAVLVYSTGKTPQLIQTITDGVPKPYSLWVDDTGILYAINLPYLSSGANLAEYEPGSGSPFFITGNDIPDSAAVAVDSNQNVYLAGSIDSKSILELYPKGSSTPSRTFTVPSSGTLSAPESLTFDPSGNLLVGVLALPKQDNAVFRFSPGSAQFTNLGLKKMPGAIVAADAAGNLYVGGDDATGDTRTIAVYAPNQTKASRKIHLPPSGFAVTGLTVSAGGTLYVGSRSLVYEYAPGSRKPKTTLNSNAPGIFGLALSP
jgi:hypothetical protein